MIAMHGQHNLLHTTAKMVCSTCVIMELLAGAVQQVLATTAQPKPPRRWSSTAQTSCQELVEHLQRSQNMLNLSTSSSSGARPYQASAAATLLLVQITRMCNLPVHKPPEPARPLSSALISSIPKIDTT